MNFNVLHRRSKYMSEHMSCARFGKRKVSLKRTVIILTQNILVFYTIVWFIIMTCFMQAACCFAVPTEAFFHQSCCIFINGTSIQTVNEALAAACNRTSVSENVNETTTCRIICFSLPKELALLRSVKIISRFIFRLVWRMKYKVNRALTVN